MGHLRAVYYRAANGREPVREYIAGLDVKRRAALHNQIDRLNELSDTQPHLPFPYSSQIEGELRELRCHVGAELYRVLYRRSVGLVVLLHIFRKKARRVPRADIEIAQTRWEDFRARMDAAPRLTPRPAGHDAP